MSKKQQQSIGRAAQKTKAVLRQHVAGLVEHTLAVSEYNGHGQAAGRQGRAGHPMPKSYLNLQTGAHLSQNVCGEGFEADDLSTHDYGVVDKGDECAGFPPTQFQRPAMRTKPDQFNSRLNDCEHASGVDCPLDAEVAIDEDEGLDKERGRPPTSPHL